ncbi:pentapeptide repeat-containing protein [Streptomyces sp. NRRL WC-3618]|uniref:pentapeptide repeat-containing protein n=1 Tax=Streptomyces sp. NRRL WC-3618 TaxID=1519490 RepID=UPI0006AFE4D3|nr:pentapeptide repeat-containing protein [Streptomyces sp. NRRL WC-3618]
MSSHRGPLSPVAIGALLMATGLVGIVVGHVSAKGWTWSGMVSDIGTSVGAELIAVAVTVLMIDRLAERRESARLRQQLVREASSTDHGLALRAVLELDVRGWLAEGALVEARLRDANLHDIVLEGQDLHGADLVGANLRKANLSRANLTDCDFNNADLSEAVIEMADFTGARLQDAQLNHADMAQAVLRSADLAGANLAHSDLTEADLRGAVLRGADLTGCLLDNIRMDSSTTWDETTRWPAGFSPQAVIGAAI